VVQVNPRETGRFYLSSIRKNEQNLIYSLQDYISIPLDAILESLRTFQEDGTKDNGVSLEGELSLEDKTLMTGKLTMRLEGVKNPYLKLVGNPDAVKGYLVGGLGQSAVKSYEIGDLEQESCDAELMIDKKNPLEEIGGYCFLNLPNLSAGVGQYHLEGMSDARETTLKLPNMIDESYSFTLILPDKWQLLNPETKLKVENDAGSVEIEIYQKKNTVVIEKTLKTNPSISFLQYSGFLELIRAFSDEKYNRLVLIPAN
jgi:hypothetical protein